MQTMRPIRETIPLDEALALMIGAAVPIARTERVSLWNANGRVRRRNDSRVARTCRRSTAPQWTDSR